MKGEALKERPVGGRLLLSGHALSRECVCVCVCFNRSARRLSHLLWRESGRFPVCLSLFFCDFKSGLLMFFQNVDG